MARGEAPRVAWVSISLQIFSVQGALEQLDVLNNKKEQRMAALEGNREK